MIFEKRSLKLILVVFLFSAGQVFSQKIFIDENIGYWNNINNEVHVNHNVFFNNDSAYIFMEIAFSKGNFYTNYNYIYELHESYHTLNILETDTLPIQNHVISNKPDKIFISFTLPNKEKTDLVVFKIINKKTRIDFVYDIPFIEDYNFSSDGLIFYDKDGTTPYLNSFINTSNSLIVQSINDYKAPVFVYYYAQYFDEAVPPMIIEDQRAAKELIIDSVFTIQCGYPIHFEDEGLYFFQKDSSSANGIGIRVQDTFFPLVKTFDKVLEPLIYISTRAETDEIRNARNPEKAFENYWINLVKIPSLATATVKNYYNRVEAANYLFTNFEEGWKSDMGIIYIIYGPPNDVYKSEEIIDWVYNRDLNMPVIRFSFYKVKNVFTDNHYTLLRKKNYDKNWFKSVEMWRNGKK